MQRESSHHRASLRAAPVALALGEIEEDVLTRVGPIDPDATHVVRSPVESWFDVPVDHLAPITEDEDAVTERVSFSMPATQVNSPRIGLRSEVRHAGPPASVSLRAPVSAPSAETVTVAPPSVQLRAAEARRTRDRLSASFTMTPSGKKTLCAPPIDLDGDQTVDPPARISPPMRVVETLMPARVSFPPPHYAPPTSPHPLGEELEAALRDTARRPLAPPVLTQLPSYLRPHAPSSIAPLAAPASSPATQAASRASTFLLAALLVIGIGTTAVMGTATFAPGTLARGRTLVGERIGYAHAPPAANPAPTYEPAPPLEPSTAKAVPPVLGEATDAGL